MIPNNTPPEIARQYFSICAGDLKARLIMNELASRAENRGDRKTAIILMRACIYLEDRLSYEVHCSGDLELGEEGQMRWNMGSYVVPIRGAK